MSNATSREENQKTKWELVGDVSVDTGQVVIVDPCYVDTPEREIGNSIRIALPFFEDVMDSLGITSIPEEEKQEKVVLEKIKSFMKVCGQINYGDTSHGDGSSFIASNTGYGDGSYEVYAKVEKLEDWGRRVVGLWVDFACDEEVPIQFSGDIDGINSAFIIDTNDKISGWELVGEFSVDTGQVMIIDPAYLPPSEDLLGKIDEIFDEEKLYERAGNDFDKVSKLRNRFGEVQMPGGERCIVSRTGLGDGNYPVHAYLEGSEGGHGTVLGLWIDFECGEHLLELANP